MRRATAALLCLWLVVGPVPVTQAAAEAARVIAVTPARVGDLVVVRLVTEGLPGERLLQSMHSGLVSAVDLDLAVLDDREKVIGGNRLTLQLGFDLWEEVFSVRGDGQERRFQSLDDLEAYLAELRQVPVIPADRLEPASRYRLRIGLQVHPIAPAEQDRVEDVIVGDQRPRREGQDQQEASVSLGRLIRFFYKGGGRDRAGQETLSGWFTGKELSDEAH
jgi:hypothetical protein